MKETKQPNYMYQKMPTNTQWRASTEQRYSVSKFYKNIYSLSQLQELDYSTFESISWWKTLSEDNKTRLE